MRVPPQNPRPQSRRLRNRQWVRSSSELLAKDSRKVQLIAFTLVELLVVIAVIVVILGLAGPAINSLKSSGDINKAVYDIAGVLEQARAYAMSKNTYVYVGVNESDVSTSESDRQTFGSTKIGRIALAVIAAKDGTSSVDPATGKLDSSKCVVVGKVQIFSNLHLADLTDQGKTPQTGTMSRPPWGGSNSIDPKYNVGTTSCVSTLQFEYPLGSTSGSGRYTFAKVIQYDPQGVARIQVDAAGTVPRQIEVGIQQTHGNSAPALTPPVTSGGVAVVQVEGISGSTHLYRP